MANRQSPPRRPPPGSRRTVGLARGARQGNGNRDSWRLHTSVSGRTISALRFDDGWLNSVMFEHSASPGKTFTIVRRVEPNFNAQKREVHLSKPARRIEGVWVGMGNPLAFDAGCELAENEFMSTEMMTPAELVHQLQERLARAAKGIRDSVE